MLWIGVKPALIIVHSGLGGLSSFHNSPNETYRTMILLKECIFPFKASSHYIHYSHIKPYLIWCDAAGKPQLKHSVPQCEGLRSRVQFVQFSSSLHQWAISQPAAGLRATFETCAYVLLVCVVNMACCEWGCLVNSRSKVWSLSSQCVRPCSPLIHSSLCSCALSDPDLEDCVVRSIIT